MPTTKTLAVALLFLVAWLAPGKRLPDDNPFTVHEWGTFTSVAGPDGRAVSWAPLHGPADLPCFVERLGRGNLKYVAGLVRMETPVLYFYSQNPVTLRVQVDFPSGWITEWFPKASAVAPAAADNPWPGHGRIEWNKVEVTPAASPANFPGSRGASHYYAARNTDAAPVRVGDQWEKLIFYRGIGNFAPPLRPVFQPDGRLQVTNAGDDPVTVAIWFENRNGQLTYRAIRDLAGTAALDPAREPGALEPLLADLTGYLVESGLHRKEAAAMVETWKNSWFEPGSRLIYVMPRRRVDELLPLKIEPSPASVARVFVGRAELFAPWVREAMRAGDYRQFGRFASPFLSEMMRAGEVVKWPAMPAPPVSRVDGPTCVE